MKRSKLFLRFLLSIVLIVLIFPAVQSLTHVISEDILGGYTRELPEPLLTGESWVSGEYQIAKEKKINEVFGFRAHCIKINNQILYSFFSKSSVSEIVIGKDGYLYEGRYIKSYYGEDYVGNKTILHRMQKLKFIQDTLAKLNKTFLLVLTPGKASFYPEYIPDEWKSAKKKTNFDDYLDRSKQLGLNHIDFYHYFIDNKDKYKYPLFSKTGLHWSVFGATVAADSLIRYIENKRHIDMPNLFWKENEIRFSSAKGMDYDLANGMNLLVTLSTKQMAYPVVHYQSDSAKMKPSILVVGDSFYWPMYHMGIDTVFSNAQFWYYNEQIHPGNASTSMVNLKEEIEHHDVIVLMSSESTSVNLGWGFIETIYQLFHENEYDPLEFKKAVEAYRVIIKANPEWMKGIEVRAIRENLTIDSIITADAVWETRKMLKDKLSKKWSQEKYEEEIEATRTYILSDERWMKEVSKRAKERGLTVDSVVTLDAIWEVDKKRKEQE